MTYKRISCASLFTFALSFLACTFYTAPNSYASDKERAFDVGNGIIIDSKGISIGEKVVEDNPGSMHVGNLYLGNNRVSSKNSGKNEKGKTIYGSVTTVGNFQAENAVIDSVSSVGRITIKKSRIKGDVSSSGNISISESSVEGDVGVSGRVQMNKIIVEGDIDASGRINLNHTTVIGDFDSSGRTQITGSLIKKAIGFSGRMDVKESRVIGLVEGSTAFTANNSRFLLAIKIRTNSSISLSYTEAQDVILDDRDIDGVQKRAELILDKSKVRNVKFTSGHGVVILKGDSVITGTLSGGSVHG